MAIHVICVKAPRGLRGILRLLGGKRNDYALRQR